MLTVKEKAMIVLLMASIVCLLFLILEHDYQNKQAVLMRDCEYRGAALDISVKWVDTSSRNNYGGECLVQLPSGKWIPWDYWYSLTTNGTGQQ